MSLSANSPVAPSLTVPNAAALAALETAGLPDGELVLKTDDQTIWKLAKTSTTATSATCIATKNSSSGASAGRWKQDSAVEIAYDDSLVLPALNATNVQTAIDALKNGQSDLVFASRTAMSTFDTTNVVDGSTSRTSNVIAFWRLNKSSSLTVDGIEVVAATPTGRWIRTQIPVWENVVQATWFVDPTNGSNENDGLTSGTALRLQREWYTRTQAHFQNAVSLTSVGDGTGLDAFAWGVIADNTSANFGFTLSGSVNVFSTGSMTSAATAEVPSTNTGPTVTDTLRVWTASVGKIIQTTSGSSRIAVVLQDLGGGVARVSPWADPNAGFAPASAPLINTTYQIVDMTALNFAESETLGSSNMTVEFIKLTGGFRTHRDARVALFECQVNLGSGTSGLSTGGFQAFVCSFFTTDFAVDAGNSSFIQCCGFTSNLILAGGTRIILNDNVFQGAGVQISTGANQPSGGFVGATGNNGFFSAATGIAVTAGGTFRLGSAATLYGSGNTIGVQLLSGGTMIVRSGYQPTITGTTELSFPNGSTGVLPPNAVRSGTDTLATGTKTVTVSTTSKTRIAASRNTPAGTLGAGGLTIPQASRTGSNFVVNAVDLAGAVVGTETSTFDYHLIEDPTTLTTWAGWFAAPFSGTVIGTDGTKIITG